MVSFSFFAPLTMRLHYSAQKCVGVFPSPHLIPRSWSWYHMTYGGTYTYSALDNSMTRRVKTTLLSTRSSTPRSPALPSIDWTHLSYSKRAAFVREMRTIVSVNRVMCKSGDRESDTFSSLTRLSGSWRQVEPQHRVGISSAVASS